MPYPVLLLAPPPIVDVLPVDVSHQFTSGSLFTVPENSASVDSQAHPTNSQGNFQDGSQNNGSQNSWLTAHQPTLITLRFSPESGSESSSESPLSTSRPSLSKASAEFALEVSSPSSELDREGDRPEVDIPDLDIPAPVTAPTETATRPTPVLDTIHSEQTPSSLLPASALGTSLGVDATDRGNPEIWEDARTQPLYLTELPLLAEIGYGQFELAQEIPIAPPLLLDEGGPSLEEPTEAELESEDPPDNALPDALPSETDDAPTPLSDELPDALPGDWPDELPDELPSDLPNNLPGDANLTDEVTDDLPDGLPNELPEDAEPGTILVIPGTPPEEALSEEEPTEDAVESSPPPDPLPTGTFLLEGIVELTADRQEYDSINRIFIATGNAVMRFQGGTLAADILRVNLPNRTAIAEGDVVLTRGQQVLRGDRFTYNFVQEQGFLLGVRGEVFIPGAGTDFAPTELTTDVTAGTLLTGLTLSEQILAEQPLTSVFSPGGINFVVGGGGRTPVGQTALGSGGEVARLRFEAEQVDLDGENWEATNVRLTNDPFSPPELEVRSRRVTFTRLSPTRSEIRARNPRLVFDQGLSLPLLRDRVIIDRERRNPSLVQFGFDDDERGGFFIERSFGLVSSTNFNLTVTPQLLLQRALFDNDGFGDPTSYGLIAVGTLALDTLTNAEATVIFTNLDLGDLENTFRSSVRVQRQVFTPIGTHNLAVEYSYRDRLFNGSLGFQDVQRSLGFVFTSPSILLGDTGIALSYQLGAQSILADTDRLDLLEPIRENNRVDLGRFQSSFALSRAFTIWSQPPLPATPGEGLRYSPNPLSPYVNIITGVRGVFGYYTSGDTQATLTGSVGLQGQFGHFSRDFFDYTAFNITYSQSAIDGLSPFLFDRSVDEQVLYLGVTQQIYGPVRLGFQTSINLETDREIDTIWSLEYSRRTYAITLSYSPVRETGFLGLRISDFNWQGTPQPFSGPGTRTVDSGVQRSP
jgi:hypothetical protein